MKKIIIFCVLLLNISAFAQTKALTDEGKEVVLFDNGTWKFVNESDAKTLENIVTNANVFKKNKSANFLLKSKKLDVGLYFDPKKWSVNNKTNNQFTEYLFSPTESESMLVGMMSTEKLEVPNLKNLKDILISGLQMRVDFFRLKESEYRTVNGLKVLYLRYIANSKGLDFEYAGYYYLNSSGYCGIVAFSLQKDFDYNFPEIQDFLNGISLAKKEEIKEKIEYSSPPPPMQYKKD